MTPTERACIAAGTRSYQKWLTTSLRNFQAIQASLEARLWNSRNDLEAHCPQCLRRVGETHVESCIEAGQIVTDPRPVRIEAWWRAEGARWMDANSQLLNATRAVLFAAVNRRVDTLFLGDDPIARSLAANEAYSGAWARRLEQTATCDPTKVVKRLTQS